jgi:hypothetical protein
MLMKNLESISNLRLASLHNDRPLYKYSQMIALTIDLWTELPYQQNSPVYCTYKHFALRLVVILQLMQQ